MPNTIEPRELPGRKLAISDRMTRREKAYAEGWNACIDSLLVQAFPVSAKPGARGEGDSIDAEAILYLRKEIRHRELEMERAPRKNATPFELERLATKHAVFERLLALILKETGVEIVGGVTDG